MQAPAVAINTARGRALILLWTLKWLGLGAFLTALAYQVPARHTVQVGRNDSSYVQGFEDAANRWGVTTDDTGLMEPFRWSGPESALIFPQIGLPAQATLRWRAWRPPGTPPPRVRVLLNGREELGVIPASGEWEEHSLSIDTGLSKPRDLFLQLVVDPPLVVDGLRRGVQLDRVVFETAGWPIAPYPAQILGGSLATLLAAIRFRGHPRALAAVVCGMALLFLLFYRLQLTPYSFRLFWPIAIVLLLGAVIVEEVEAARLGRPPLALAHGASVQRLALGVAALTLLLWTMAAAWASRAHVVLSLPGVENDFRVFATRSDTLFCPGGTSLEAGCVLRADGFYQLGYPFLLWLLRPVLSDNPFLAARLVALFSGFVLLGVVYLLGRLLLGPVGAVLALLFVVLNRWTAEFSLSLGTDMPFAAVWTAALLALLVVGRSYQRAVLAGILCGATFMLRHPGIVLLPLGCGLLLWCDRREAREIGRRFEMRASLPLIAGLLGGFAIAILPQVIVNVADTGKPFYSQQAKNIWLAVYGATDWGRWAEASNDVSVLDVVAHDPGRFATNWWANVRGFWATGSEDTSEFGRALALRILTFPANLLALGGLALWLLQSDWRLRFLLLAATLYTSLIAVGFLLPRFVLPLLPIWGLAAATATQAIWSYVCRDVAPGSRRMRHLLVAGMLVFVLMLQAPAAGISNVLLRQNGDAAAAATLISRVVPPTDRVVSRLPAGDSLDKYSAIAHRIAPPDAPDARYLLETNEAAQEPPDVEVVGRAGRYVLYRSLR